MIDSPIGRRVCAVACAAAIATVGGLTAAAATGGSPAIGTGPTHSSSIAAVPKNAHVSTGKLPTLGATGSTFPSTTLAGGSHPRVVGGSPVDSSAYPSVVGIATYFWLDTGGPTTTRYESICTGTVLAATKVLTAATCLDEEPDSSTFVIAGRNILADTTSGFVSQAASVWTDPSFDILDYPPPIGTPTNNVAVITLATALPAAYPPISLTAQGASAPYAAGTAATTVGYGASQDSDLASTGVLNAGSVQIQSTAACTNSADVYGYPFDPTELTCAGVPSGATAACFEDEGGPLLENGVEVGITNLVYPGECSLATTYPTYEKLSAYNKVLTAGAAATPAEDLGFSGSGHADLLAVDNAGNLQLYSGSGYLQPDAGYTSFVPESTMIGTGWGAFKTVLRVTGWDVSGPDSVLAVAQNGNLYEYPTDGEGGFTNRGNGILIGSGFAAFTKLVAADDFTGDGKPDLIGVAANGNLDLFEGNGAGGWSNASPIVIGTGWGGFNQLVSAGDWNKDGRQVLIGESTGGALTEYESTGVGTWTNPGGKAIGSGFTYYSKLVSVGDWNGDQNPDLIGVTTSGQMYLYETDGKGNWTTGSGILIGTGFVFPKLF